MINNETQLVSLANSMLASQTYSSFQYQQPQVPPFWGLYLSLTVNIQREISKICQNDIEKILSSDNLIRDHEEFITVCSVLIRERSFLALREWVSNPRKDKASVAWSSDESTIDITISRQTETMSTHTQSGYSLWDSSPSLTQEPVIHSGGSCYDPSRSASTNPAPQLEYADGNYFNRQEGLQSQYPQDHYMLIPNQESAITDSGAWPRQGVPAVQSFSEQPADTDPGALAWKPLERAPTPPLPYYSIPADHHPQPSWSPGAGDQALRRTSSTDTVCSIEEWQDLSIQAQPLLDSEHTGQGSLPWTEEPQRMSVLEQRTLLDMESKHTGDGSGQPQDRSIQAQPTLLGDGSERGRSIQAQPALLGDGSEPPQDRSIQTQPALLNQESKNGPRVWTEETQDTQSAIRDMASQQQDGSPVPTAESQDQSTQAQATISNMESEHTRDGSLVSTEEPPQDTSTRAQSTIPNMESEHTSAGSPVLTDVKG
ncbi:hypothetical protein JB92DRAFT_2830805 [Gautieria morchelliformis]|nr:hypothetical protein JB92DRAFT_2830805 [Gautieria morchelliformis]